MRRAAALAAALACAAAALAADDAAEAFRRAAAALPAPSPAGAFTFAGEILVGEEVFGTFEVSASATAEAGRGVWFVRSRTETGSGASLARTDEEAFLTARLAVLRGRGESSGPRGRRGWTFAADATGYRFEPGGVVAHEGDAMSGLAALLLFARLAVDVSGSCGFSYLDAGAEGGPRIEPSELRPAASGEFRGREALVARGRRGDADLTLALDPATRIPWGVRIRHEAEDLTLWLLPKGSGRPALPADFFDRPALSPEAGAARAALALLAGDSALAERAFHWPSLYAEYRRANPRDGQEYPLYRQAALAGIAASPERRPRGEAEAVLRAVYGALVPEPAGDGRFRVRFRAPLAPLAFVVAEVAGEWRVVALPDRR